MGKIIAVLRNIFLKTVQKVTKLEKIISKKAKIMTICVKKNCPLQKEQNGVICEYWTACGLKELGDGENIPIVPKSPVKRTKPKETNNLSKYTPLEGDDQESLFEYFSWKGIEMIHIPNERKCSFLQGETLKRQGVRKGVPDNFFPYHRGRYHGLFIELKRMDKKLSKVSEDQEEWREKLEKLGYAVRICFGFDEAIKCVEEYFRLKEN